jgi:hypothetical protein
MGLVIIFYSLRFETSIFFASYDSQGHGGGIRPRLHTDELTNLSRSLLPETSRHAHTWHRAPLGPMVIYLFNVKILVFLLLLILLIDKGGLVFYIYIDVHLIDLTPPEVIFSPSQGFSRIYIHLINY